VAILNTKFTRFYSARWYFFHWKLHPWHFIFSMSILCAVRISLFSTNKKLQVDVNPPSNEIFDFYFCTVGEGFYRNIFIFCAASLKCSSSGLNSKSCTKFSLISTQFDVWSQAS
jgi:hypothetical protein